MVRWKNVESGLGSEMTTVRSQGIYGLEFVKSTLLLFTVLDRFGGKDRETGVDRKTGVDNHTRPRRGLWVKFNRNRLSLIE